MLTGARLVAPTDSTLISNDSSREKNGRSHTFCDGLTLHVRYGKRCPAGCLNRFFNSPLNTRTDAKFAVRIPETPTPAAFKKAR